MTQEEKKLLFIDLCARLPYYPYALFDLDKKFDGGFQAPIIGMVNKGNTGVIKYNQEFYAYGCMTPFNIEEFRIYLRPMSSMTEEEREDYRKAFDKDFDILEDSIDAQIAYKYSDGMTVRDKPLFNEIDWLNKHNFDYRGLIDKGLTLKAPEGMYNKH
jgi:hypothetical protein